MRATPRTSSGRRAASLLVLALASALAVTGCSTPPWAVAAAAPSTSATSARMPPPVVNDLATGSTQHVLTAGPLTVTVDYWSTLTMDKWMPGALKPVSLSLVSTVAPDDGQKVYLQRATLIATPRATSASFAPQGTQIDTATETPGYLMRAPYSYSQTFSVGPTPDAATWVTLDVTYEFLVQATPTSTDYAKQTASDSLTVTIAR